MMGELVGGLIQMNSHMEMTGTAEIMLAVGITAAAVTLTLLIVDIVSGESGWRFRVFLGAVALMGAVAVIVAANMPREQIIHACASGQVSLEQVSAKYDIVDVDGKELTLRVR